MTIRIGANPIIWSNDDLRSLGATTSLETCLREARLAGVEGMEMGHKFPHSAPELKKALSPHNLEFISGWWSTNLLVHDEEAEFRAISAHLRLLKEMGCQVCIVCETSNSIQGAFDTPLSQRPILDDASWSLFTARMTRLGDHLVHHGIDLVYHHHMGTVVQSRQDIARFMDNTGPSVNLLLDTGHALWGGADPAELARTYRKRIKHVHAKDLRADKRAQADVYEWSFLRGVLSGVFTVPGDGGIDYRRIFGELPDYDGWVVIEAEQDPELANPLVYVRMGRNHLMDVLRGVG